MTRRVLLFAAALLFLTGSPRAGDADVRYYAVWAVGLVGPDAAGAAGDLLEAVGDRNDGVRRKAIYSLGRVGADPALALPALFRALDDTNPDVRRTAADALAKYG